MEERKYQILIIVDGDEEKLTELSSDILDVCIAHGMAPALAFGPVPEEDLQQFFED